MHFEKNSDKEISCTSVFETFRWETIPVAILYVAVSVLWPRLPPNQLAPHDDHTRTFPELWSIAAETGTRGKSIWNKG